MARTNRKAVRETRNTKVVLALVASMTVGAVFLTTLQPKGPAAPDERHSGLLMATADEAQGLDVFIYYADADAVNSDTAAAYGCVVGADGEVSSTAVLENPVHLLVLGSAAGRLSPRQKENLLLQLRAMAQAARQDLRIQLHPASDAALQPSLPGPAHDLRNLLVRKGMIR